MIETRSASPALDELWSHIGRAYHNYKLLLERTLRRFGLERHVRAGMGHVLFTLFEKDDCIIRDITEATELSFPTITVTLQKMKKAGLVELRRDPNDGRAVRVRLTERGRSIETRCNSVVRHLGQVLERGLSPKEVAVAKQAIRRMVENMREEELTDRRKDA